uniref:SCP domain-containing protein n=1 Tax=Parascaris univalens TaxID=6257 RepID=A0A915C759_PARUN
MNAISFILFHRSLGSLNLMKQKRNISIELLYEIVINGE